MRATCAGRAAAIVHGARTGLTLPEVLVACALLAILGSSVAGLLIAGARLQVATSERTARTRVLEPYAVPGARAGADLPGCDALDGRGEPRACVRDRRRCRLDGTVVRCDGAGTLMRVDIDVVGGGTEGPPLRVWEVVP